MTILLTDEGHLGEDGGAPEAAEKEQRHRQDDGHRARVPHPLEDGVGGGRRRVAHASSG